MALFDLPPKPGLCLPTKPAIVRPYARPTAEYLGTFTFPVGFVGTAAAAPPPATRTYGNQRNRITPGGPTSTFNFGSLNTGAAGLLIICVQTVIAGSGAIADVSSLTVGGSGASIVTSRHGDTINGSHFGGIYQFVSGGGSQAIVVNTPPAHTGATIDLYVLQNLTTNTRYSVALASNADSVNGSTSCQDTVNVNANGVVVGMACHAEASNPSVGGLNVDNTGYDFALGGFAVGSRQGLSAQALIVSCSGGANTSRVIVAASWY